MDWETIAERADLIGCDLEINEEGKLYRGPLSKIELLSGTVYFETAWMAQKAFSGKWDLWPISKFSVDAEKSIIQSNGSGYIFFKIPGGRGIIYMLPRDRLEPSAVRGSKEYVAHEVVVEERKKGE